MFLECKYKSANYKFVEVCLLGNLEKFNTTLYTGLFIE